jgi:hypothetical protein
MWSRIGRGCICESRAVRLLGNTKMGGSTGKGYRVVERHEYRISIVTNTAVWSLRHTPHGWGVLLSDSHDQVSISSCTIN